jgi:hypothetical protein
MPGIGQSRPVWYCIFRAESLNFEWQRYWHCSAMILEMILFAQGSTKISRILLRAYNIRVLRRSFLNTDFLCTVETRQTDSIRIHKICAVCFKNIEIWGHLKIAKDKKYHLF